MTITMPTKSVELPVNELVIDGIHYTIDLPNKLVVVVNHVTRYAVPIYTRFLLPYEVKKRIRELSCDKT